MKDGYPNCFDLLYLSVSQSHTLDIEFKGSDFKLPDLTKQRDFVLPDTSEFSSK